ncbi:hypothetical protein [Thioalkalivibrio sp. ALJT]|uniref:hypothetical protein n=1 Tax=Thioalkalivibrio sp. ALJT TaxID=1158146 RepID=UPI0003731CF5|nr:hypothetical protein [Thioalkalivibrio sp. ALJT]
MNAFTLRPFLLTGLCTLLLAASPLHGGAVYAPAAKDPTAAEMEELRKSWAETREELEQEGQDGDTETGSRTRETLDAMDQKLGHLREQIREGWDDLSEGTRARRERAYDGLVEERDRLAEWSGDMRSRSSEAWGGVREGAREAWGGVRDGSRKAWDSVRDAFRDDDASADTDRPAQDPE